jgi:hypothetical protein
MEIVFYLRNRSFVRYDDVQPSRMIVFTGRCPVTTRDCVCRMMPSRHALGALLLEQG